MIFPPIARRLSCLPFWKMSRDEAAAPRVSHLADLIKSDYFRLSDNDLNDADSCGSMLSMAVFYKRSQKAPRDDTAERELQLKKRHRIGFWDADALENAFAYVGSELRVSDWLTRAAKLIKELPGAEATREL